MPDGRTWKALAELDKPIKDFFEEVEKELSCPHVQQERISRFQVLQVVFAAAVLVVFSVVLWITRGIVHRTRALAQTAQQIAGGDLNLIADIHGGDELALLGISLTP